MNASLRSLVAVIALLAATVFAAEPTRNLSVSRGDAPASEQRIALVIGNSTYKSSPLVNPVNDARAVSARLRSLGFTVIERQNLTLKQIGSTLREFRSKLTPGSVALFFYAGHGLQVKGSNYLPVVDADITGEEDVSLQSLDVGKVLELMDDAKTRLNLVFLDACRNNPYARSFRSAADGLAKITAPSGTLISFATRPGSVAADGTGRNGLYTEKLLIAMNETGQPIEQVLKRVVSSVKTSSSGRQEPWMEGSIEGDFCFGTCNGSSSTAPASVPPDGAAIELAFWESIKSSDDTEDFKDYLDKYPNGQFVALAERRVKRKPITAIAPEENKTTTLAPGNIFKDCPECPEMVVVPPGSFQMGIGHPYSHQVSITRPFAIAKTEVTQKQWRDVMGRNSSKFSGCGDNCPVDQVTWREAEEFVKKLSQKTGKTYRLPSESEWEYACLGGQQYGYCGSDDLDSVGWYGMLLGNSGGTTHPVATKKPNAFGLYDMSGNVEEWVEDCYYSYKGATTDGSVSPGECGDDSRVKRGGSAEGGTGAPHAKNRATVREYGFGLVGVRPVRMLQ